MEWLKSKDKRQTETLSEEKLLLNKTVLNNIPKHHSNAALISVYIARFGCLLFWMDVDVFGLWMMMSFTCADDGTERSPLLANCCRSTSINRRIYTCTDLSRSLKNIVSQFPTYLVSSQLQTTLSQGLTGAAKVPFPDFLSHSIRVFIYKSSKFLFKLDAVRAIYPPSIYSRASSRDLLMKHFPQQEKGQTRPLEVQRDAVIMGSVQESPAPAASTRSFPFMCGLAPC
ncbi:hypothetical protein QQF64_008048 [Cirrhinus molitorella]|uniref:Uncharacterized protein n=1 Tax=Cirrhinus molitorella TaxID=172907 RepID=A0ABR3M7D3_9TELE